MVQRRRRAVRRVVVSGAALAAAVVGCSAIGESDPITTIATPSSTAATTGEVGAPTGVDRESGSVQGRTRLPYLDPGLPVQTRVDDLMVRMSIEEKVGQMTQVEPNSISLDEVTELGIGSIVNGGNGSPPRNTPADWAEWIDGFQRAATVSRLGIPLLYAVDAVHGFGNVYGATVFPHHIGLGAANEPELVQQIGRATATEMAATGAWWNLAPTLAVPEDIRWGRTYEGFSEVPEIVASLGVAEITGLQTVDGSPPLVGDTDVIATAKHFVGDGATAWGSSTDDNSIIDQGDARLDEATLRARLLPVYAAAIDVGVRSVMVSFSSWNGEKIHGSRHLLTDVLKGELQFGGVVLSDWGGINQLPGDYDDDIVTAINAGIDVVMVPFDHQAFRAGLLAAIERGDVSTERIDDAVRRVLTVKFESGLFEQPFARRDLLDAVGSEAHRQLAREAVRRSAVLLKNDDVTVPISPTTPTILVAGNAADDVGLQSGGWTIDHQGGAGDVTIGSTILDGIAEIATGEVIVDPTGEFTDRPEQTAEIGIVVVAERPYAEGLGDRADLALPAADVEVIDRVRRRVARLVVVLLSGRPLVVTEQLPGWDAFVAAWLPGSEGAGVADTLFGSAPFTGRLPMSWPRSNAQLDSDWTSAAACDGPLFPVGYGLGGDDPPAPPSDDCPS